jgi:hypothetical protein
MDGFTTRQLITGREKERREKTLTTAVLLPAFSCPALAGEMHAAGRIRIATGQYRARADYN